MIRYALIIGLAIFGFTSLLMWLMCVAAKRYGIEDDEPIRCTECHRTDRSFYGENRVCVPCVKADAKAQRKIRAMSNGGPS